MELTGLTLFIATRYIDGIYFNANLNRASGRYEELDAASFERR
jgi:hypothetical protein